MEYNKENNGVPALKSGSDFGSDLAQKVGTIVFAKNLKKRRNELGYSQQKISNLTGIGLKTIQNYESGSFPKGDYVIALANVLGCSLDWLLMDKGPEPGPPGKEKQIDKPEPLYNKEELVVGVAESVSEYGAGMDDFGKAAAGLKEIFDSRDPVLIPAIQANIHAFQISVRRERQIQQQANKISALEKENTNIKARLEALEKHLPPTNEHTEKKVM